MIINCTINLSTYTERFLLPLSNKLAPAKRNAKNPNTANESLLQPSRGVLKSK